MADIYLTNTLTHKKDKFVPVREGEVGVYSCGPTVYWNQHIGNMYAFVEWDLLVRFLRYVGYKVTWVVNITDVGHMTSDEDAGQDKMEKGAEREGLTVWKLADKYIKQFTGSLKLLNVQTPDVMPRATEHIEDQIALIKKIEEKGFTYSTKMGVVFDTSKFPDYAKFANLMLENLKMDTDLVKDAEKRHPWDFFLWITGSPKHIMQWDSPWGKGYPGWHIECTAMSTKYLGDKFDIHTGGIEHIPVHHTNEIAQGFAAFGTQTANYWLHNAHLLGKSGEKMSKSLGNFALVQDLVKKGYNPLALRYLYLTSHYKKGLNFSWEALDGAVNALNNLQEIVDGLKSSERKTLSDEKMDEVEDCQKKFVAALSDDLNVPQALAVLWETLKSNIPAGDKYDLAISFDEVLGLRLGESSSLQFSVSNKVKELLEMREQLRKEGKFDEADEVRKKINEMGFKVEDTPEGARVKPAK